MKLISWNVNGLRAAVGKNFMEFFDEADADIFCLQETKLTAGQIELNLPGYYQYWNYAEKKGYSGTAVFTKKKPLRVSSGIGIEEHDREGRVITLEFEKFYLVNVYVPNSRDGLARLDYRMMWEDAFRGYIHSLESGAASAKMNEVTGATESGTASAKMNEVTGATESGAASAKMNEVPGATESGAATRGKPVIFCGDLNVAHKPIDLKNPATNHHNAGFTDEERGKMTELLDSGMIDTYRYFYPDRVEYSWWSYRFHAREKNAGWRIDYFIVSEALKDNLADAKIHTDVMGSDHCPVELDVKGL